MELFLLSFLAGVLTVFAPCVFTLLPITLGGSISSQSKYRPYVIAISLGVSVFIFTLLLKASTLLLGIHPSVWQIISGGILIVFGLFTIFPNTWELISGKLGLQQSSNTALQKAYRHEGLLGAALVGMALGPTFSSCSPTYTLILATVLPANFSLGLLYLATYCIGLILIILLVGILGSSFTEKYKWLSNPNNLFKKILGIVFILIGISIIFGLDKQLETLILDADLFNSTQIELQILERLGVR